MSFLIERFQAQRKIGHVYVKPDNVPLCFFVKSGYTVSQLCGPSTTLSPGYQGYRAARKTRKYDLCYLCRIHLAANSP